MDSRRSSLTICARAPAFRPVLLGIVLFWCVVFYASAAQCESGFWKHPDNTFTSPSTDDVCAWYGLEVGAVPYTCYVDPSQSFAVITYNGGPDEHWLRVGGAPPCASPEDPASLIPLADAIDLAWGIGGAWLIVASILFVRRAAV
jgi:hypothetical protein